MTLNGVMALILRYFTELRCRREKFTFAISSPDEFLVFFRPRRSTTYVDAACSLLTE